MSVVYVAIATMYMLRALQYNDTYCPRNNTAV